jgi:hypothetical protein
MKYIYALPLMFVLAACGGNGSSDTQNLTGTYSAFVVNATAEYNVDIAISETGAVTGSGTYQSNAGIPDPHSVTVSGNALSNSRLNLVFTHPSTSQVEPINFDVQITSTGFTGIDNSNSSNANLQYSITANQTP